MKSAGRKARVTAIALVALGCLVAPSVATGAADGYVPGDAARVETAEDLTPIWIFHGDAEGAGDLEKFVIEDNDVRGFAKGMTDIELTLDGRKYPDGGLDLSKVITYRAIQTGMSRLWPEDVPVREDLAVETWDPSGSTRGTLEYVTRAVSRGAFELAQPGENGTVEERFSPGNYRYVFENTATDERFETHVLEGVWPQGFFSLAEKVLNGEAGETQRAEFDAMWEEVRETFLTGQPEDLFYMEEEENEAMPVWPIVFTFGLLGLVAGTTCYSIARGRAHN